MRDGPLSGGRRIQPFALERNKVFSVRGKKIRIDCLSGALWVTWPDCREKTLQAGQSCAVRGKGKVCIFALADARINIRFSDINIP